MRFVAVKINEETFFEFLWAWLDVQKNLKNLTYKIFLNFEKFEPTGC